MAVATLMVLSITSCKKSSDIQQPQTAIEKILGIWQLQTLIENSHFSGADHIYTTSGIASDKFDFRADGRIYYSISGGKDTVAFNLPSETKILIDFVNSYDIKTLTANSFIIYKKDMVGASDYDEETITWTK